MNRLVRVELLKLRSIRTTYALLVAAAILTALLASSEASRTANHLALSSTLSAVVTSTGWTMLFATVMGVIVASGEFRHSTATLTYLAGPRRSQVLAAKAIAAAVTGAIFGLTGTAIATGIGLTATAAAGQPITLSAATLLRDDLGTILGAALLAPLGVAIGSLIRSQVAGIIAVLIWAVVLEPVIGGLFSAAQPYLPYSAATTLAGAQLGSGAGGVHVNVQHGGPAAAIATPLPFAAVVGLLGALAIVTSILAARARLWADVT
jgi:ABC-type transport system involved in multi-copper enzyme maturation permease subunit